MAWIVTSVLMPEAVAAVAATIDPAQDLGEQRPRHGHLGQLEHDVAAVAHDPGADLTSFSRKLVSDSAISRGRAKVRKKLARL